VVRPAGVGSILQPASKRHPAGLGVIASDAAADLDLIVRQVSCPAIQARVTVSIEPILG
jgi:hypothetical protein